MTCVYMALFLCVCHLPLSTNMPVFISLYVSILISNEVFGKRMCRKIPIKPQQIIQFWPCIITCDVRLRDVWCRCVLMALGMSPDQTVIVHHLFSPLSLKSIIRLTIDFCPNLSGILFCCDMPPSPNSPPHPQSGQSFNCCTDWKKNNQK